MARTISIPSTLYQPQTLVRTVDSFPPNVTALVITLTRESWPGTPEDTVMRVTTIWDDGSGAIRELPGGVINGRDGQPLLASVLRMTPPLEPDAQGRAKKKRMQGGTITVEVLQELRTAVTIEVV